jgi:hypothetical protein
MEIQAFEDMKEEERERTVPHTPPAKLNSAS